MLRLFFCCWVLLLGPFMMAQNQLGLHTGLNSGANALAYNPAIFLAGDLKWDLGILSGGAFAKTDYISIQNASIFKILSSDVSLVDATFLGDKSPSEREIYYRFNNAQKPMNTAAYAFAGLPAFALKLDRKTSIGFFVRSRVVASANNVSPMWSWHNLQNWAYGEQQNTAPIWSSGILLSEVAVNVARSYKTDHWMLNVGVNAKWLSGHESYYLFVPNSTAITLQPNFYEVETFEAFYGFTDIENGVSFTQKGQGLGFDLGVVLQSRQHKNVRISLSLNDVGRINFVSETQNHHVVASQPVQLSRQRLSRIDDAESFTQIISYEVLGGNEASHIQSDYHIFLPTTFNAVVDFGVHEHVFATATLHRRVVLSAQQAHRNQFLGMSLRYEKRWFQLGVPLILHNDNDLHLGAWVQVGPLTVGSDHILPWIVQQNNLNGADFYFGLRLSEGTFSRKRKMRTADDCYW